MTTNLFETYHEPLLKMTTAALESVYWRQDKYPAGGIVESDERVDGGKKLYWPWCWPRSFIVEPLLALKEYTRVQRFLDFFMRCQRKDGSWGINYSILDGSENRGTIPETDNVAYMLWHIQNYIAASGNITWLTAHWNMVEKAACFLKTQFNAEVHLIWGAEEANVPGFGDCIPGYALHINIICALGFQSAAKLADMTGRKKLAIEWLALSESILSDGIEKNLWDKKEKVFAFCLRANGGKVTAPVLWMTLIPHFVLNKWDDRIPHTLDYLDRTLYDRDPVIHNTYWTYDYDPWLKTGQPMISKGTGYGVWVGGLPVLIDACLKAGRLSRAGEQIEKMIELTDPDNNLIPEHVNTMHPGQIHNYMDSPYSVYPDPSCYVDSGNLVHLSFFLTLIARYNPEMLHEASKSVSG